MSDSKRSMNGKIVVKFLVLVLFLGAAVWVFRFSSARDLVTPEYLGGLLDATGWWGPAVFTLVEAASIVLFVPASIPIVVGAGLFGPSWGFFCGWVGAVLGAGAAFFLGRVLGRAFVASLIGDRLRRFDDAIERHGFTTVLYLRLLNSPFTPLNYGLSLTKVRFRDYLLGTALGVAVSVFVLTFLAGTLKKVWTSGNWEEMVSLKMGLALAVFVFSFFIPTILKKIRGPAVDLYPD